MLRRNSLLSVIVLLCIAHHSYPQDKETIYGHAENFMKAEDFDLAAEAYGYIPSYRDSQYKSLVCSLLSQKSKTISVEELKKYKGTEQAGLLFYYWLGRVQLKRFLLKDAEESFNQFLNDVHYHEGFDSYEYDVNSKLSLIHKASEKMVIQPYESPINSRYSDLPGALLGDGDRLVFMSDRNSEGDFQVFKTDKGPYGWNSPQVVSDAKISADILNVLNVKESLLFFDPNKKNLCSVELTESGWTVNEDMGLSFLSDAHHIYVNKYRTRVIFSKKNENDNLDLYESFKLRSTGEWMDPTPISGLVNSPYNEDYPFITEDRSRLYFSSNRPGGMGKCDIYYVEMDPETNMWGEPVNAGIPVNSVDDDISFSMTSENKGMISSNRIYSSGGLDLFVVELND